MKEKIRLLKKELQDLNDLFKKAVDKTKRQNDENHKIYDQNALINRLKVKIQKKARKTEKENAVNKDVINKLEKFGYGYQKTFKTKTQGNLKRQVSIGKRGKKKAKSLIRNKENLGIDYAIEDNRRTKRAFNHHMSANRGSRRKTLKRYRSLSKHKSARRGSRLEKRKSQQLLKSRSNNIERVLNTAKEIVGERRGRSKKNPRKK